MRKLKLRKNRFRLAVRKNVTSKVLTFFNTSFGLWILSTVFISFGTWTFSKWSDHKNLISARNERIFKIDTEIFERFHNVQDAIDAGRFGDKEVKLERDRFSSLYREIIGPVSEVDSLYPEFQKRGLRSLIVELESNLSGDEALCMTYALSEVSDLGNSKDITAQATGIWINGIIDYRWSGFSKMDRAGSQLVKAPERDGVADQLKPFFLRPLFCGHHVITVPN